MNRSRVDWVDAAKGLCIVFVVMMHSTLGVERVTGETGWMGAVVAFAQPFRMPDFFLISGLFLSRVVDRDWRTFLDRRVVHFFYFYVLWLVIQFAFKAPGMVAAEGAGATALVFVESLFIEPFGTLWFIWILPFFALTVRLTRRVPVPVMLAIGAALEIAPPGLPLPILDEFASRFVYFYAGYALAPMIFRLADGVAARPGAALAGLAVWGVVNGAMVAAGLAMLPFLSLGLGFAGAAAIVSAAVLIGSLPKAGDVARFLGAHSIVVYLAFFLPMGASRTVLVKTGVVPDVGTMSLIVTVAAVVVPFAIWWVAMRVGARFLFERPAWARLERPNGARARLAAAE
ncbi:acyltransferase family protein [Chthonobacter rhizosphaerae]|uniref:acyltransferase family protein n=1 Tax=Chthonobacter rhizosphaerae TaxID=2735553 RepID=UPI001FEC7A3F|nr:acyltransferase family protein [Chthonobacter rhizosphaerae]